MVVIPSEQMYSEEIVGNRRNDAIVFQAILKVCREAKFLEISAEKFKI